MIITTTHSIDGRKATEYLGLSVPNRFTASMWYEIFLPEYATFLVGALRRWSEH